MLIIGRGFSHLRRGRKIFHQFLVDQFSKIEGERLAYIGSHQRQLRIDQFQHLCNAINNNGVDAENTGILVIFSSSYTGRPLYMYQCIQDAITYVKKYVNPSLFITFTCNLNWPEIKPELFQG